MPLPESTAKITRAKLRGEKMPRKLMTAARNNGKKNKLEKDCWQLLGLEPTWVHTDNYQILKHSLLVGLEASMIDNVHTHT